MISSTLFLDHPQKAEPMCVYHDMLLQIYPPGPPPCQTDKHQPSALYANSGVSGHSVSTAGDLNRTVCNALLGSLRALRFLYDFDRQFSHV